MGQAHVAELAAGTDRREPADYLLGRPLAARAATTSEALHPVTVGRAAPTSIALSDVRPHPLTAQVPTNWCTS